MLQLRGENEQFSSLPSLRVLDHPRHSIITTDRPDSSQLVDLHVYVVPKNVWKDGQRLAQNEAMEDAVSAGFVRVSPNMTIRELRKSIETVCGKDSYFPRDFTYLRSVGRCMTKVKVKQEDELRVKNYRPPQTFAPEIYLLDGRQEDNLQENPQDRSFSPVSTSPCDVCGNHEGHRADHEKQRPRRKEPRSDPDENHSDHDKRRFPFTDHDRSPSRLSPNFRRKPMRGGKQYAPLTTSHEIFPHNSPPERHNRPKYGSDPEDSAAILSDVTNTPSSNLPKLKEEQERLRRRQGELERMRRAAEEKRARSQRSDGDRSRSDAEDENGPKNKQGSFRGHKERPNVSEQRRNTYRYDPAKRTEQDDDDDEEKKHPTKKPQTYKNSRRETFPMPQSILVKHDNPKQTNVKRPKPTGNNNDFENTRNEMIDTERRNAEAKRRQQLEDEQKKKDKRSSDQPRKDVFKGTNDDPVALRARHQEIHTRRLDLERVREEVIRHLKNIHNRITLRRKEARDLWKKKYFNEKKKHPPLEERINTLRTELDQMHKKTIQTMEAEAKYAAQMGYTKEATAGNSIAQITRTNYEIDEIRHQLEQAKLRLTTDVKLRNQAENECRTLKHELNQAKANLNDIKSRAGP